MSDNKTVKLIMVTEENNNKFYNMVDQGNGTWEAEWGRVEKTSQSKIYDMGVWDKKKREKEKKGYKEVTHLFIDENDTSPSTPAAASKVVPIKDNLIKRLMDKLQGYANQTVATNYSVSKENVTQAMIDEAQKIVDALADLVKGRTASYSEINKQLIELFMVIPRQMRQVNDHLFQADFDWDDVGKSIGDEQDTLDTMAGQVALIAKQKPTDAVATPAAVSILDQMGLVLEEASQAEFDEIKNMMANKGGDLKRAYKVANIKTEKLYQKNCKEAKNKDIDLFFHGSRNQNWFNILQTGLLIRPAGAIHTGSMFGDGIYGANKAQKAIGYSSVRGSYWASGNDTTGYIGLFAFRTGKQKHIKRHDSSCYSLNKRKLQDDGGFDSVYAHGGIDLQNDEFIVYEAGQCTIKYILELS